jgi:hypothetical protein
MDRLRRIVVRVSGYRTEMYCDSCEVRTESICYVDERRPPLWSSGQSSWLQIQRSVFDSRRHNIFSEVVSLERSPLSPVTTTGELFERKSSGSGLQNLDYGCRGTAALTTRQPLYPQKLILTSPTSLGRSVCIVRWQTQATELLLLLALHVYLKLAMFSECKLQQSFHIWKQEEWILSRDMFWCT